MRQRLSSLGGTHRGSVISTRTNLEAIVEFSAATGTGAAVPSRRPRTTSSNSELSAGSSDVFQAPLAAAVAANALLRKATMNNMMKSEPKPVQQQQQVGKSSEQLPAPPPPLRGGTFSNKPSPVPPAAQPKSSYAKEKKISFKLHNPENNMAQSHTSNGKATNIFAAACTLVCPGEFQAKIRVTTLIIFPVEFSAIRVRSTQKKLMTEVAFSFGKSREQALIIL